MARPRISWLASVTVCGLCGALAGCQESVEGNPGRVALGTRTIAAAAVSLDTTNAAAQPETSEVPQPPVALPRLRGTGSLFALWTIGGPAEPGRLVQPVHLRASRLGVLVSELDGARIRVFESRTGTQVREVGRYGLGPGEFGRVPTLLGTYDRPLAFEGANGRISVLGEEDDPVTSRVAAGHSWSSACQVDANSVVLSYVGWDDDGYFVSTLGSDAALTDSFPHPIAALGGVIPVGRQAAVYQIDDSTCVILPAYAAEFATYRRGQLEFGIGVEPAPTPRVLDGGQGVGASRRLAPGVRTTHRSATSWRGRLLILYGGSTNLRRRLVDMYDERLRYESTIVLPHVTQFISTSGDTLFALGELDDEPILAAYLLRPH